jgi:hypothetical protein
MLQSFATSFNDVISDIWNLLKQHPAEAFVLLIVLFLVFFSLFYFAHRLTPYTAILCFIIAAVLTTLLLLAIYGTPATASVLSSLCH